MRTNKLVATLKDLEKIVRKAPRFTYTKHYGESLRAGECSNETLRVEYDDNWVELYWQWLGKLEIGKGLRAEFFYSIEGRAKKKDYGYFTIEHSSDKKYLCKLRHISAMAREKYLKIKK